MNISSSYSFWHHRKAKSTNGSWKRCNLGGKITFENICGRDAWSGEVSTTKAKVGKDHSESSCHGCRAMLPPGSLYRTEALNPSNFESVGSWQISAESLSRNFPQLRRSCLAQGHAPFLGSHPMTGPPWVDAICLFKCRTSLPAKRTPELPVGLAEALILTT